MRKKEILLQLQKRQLAQDGLFAWGKLKIANTFSAFGGGVQGANSEKYIITMSGDDLCFIPLGNKELFFKNIYVVDKDNIKALKLNKFGSKMMLETLNGGVNTYHITRARCKLRKLVGKF